MDSYTVSGGDSTNVTMIVNGHELKPGDQVYIDENETYVYSTSGNGDSWQTLK